MASSAQPKLYVKQWRRQYFVTGGSEVWVYRGSRVRSPPVPVVLSVYQRGSLLDDLAMYLSCDTKKFHDNESTHILHNFWTSTHRGEASPPSSPLAAPLHCPITTTPRTPLRKASDCVQQTMRLWGDDVAELPGISSRRPTDHARRLSKH